MPNLCCRLCFSYFFPCKSCIHVYLLLLLSVIKRICLGRLSVNTICVHMMAWNFNVFSSFLSKGTTFVNTMFMYVHPHTRSSSTIVSLMMVLPISQVLVCNGVCMILYLAWKIYVWAIWGMCVHNPWLMLMSHSMYNHVGGCVEWIIVI